MTLGGAFSIFHPGGRNPKLIEALARGHTSSAGGVRSGPHAEMHMALRTRLTEKLGIEHPVLLAPIGNIAGGRLAAAVVRCARAAGFGWPPRHPRGDGTTSRRNHALPA